MKIHISEFFQLRLLHDIARHRWNARENAVDSQAIIDFISTPSWLFVQLRNLGVQTSLRPVGWLVGLCARLGFIKSTARGFGSGWKHADWFFFRARYNPCRCEAVIRAAVTRPWTLELHPTDETDYNSYQINLCLLSLAGLHPLSLPPPRLTVASPHRSPPVVSALHENSLNLGTITRTWRSARLVTQHNRCPQSVPIRIYRSSGFTGEPRSVESICDRGWSSRFATSLCCRSSLRFYEKGLGANQRACYNESITARSVSSAIACIQCKEITFFNNARDITWYRAICIMRRRNKDLKLSVYIYLYIISGVVRY